MNEDKKWKMIGIFQMIAENMEREAREFDRRPFNGGTVGEYFERQGAAIAAIADNLILIVKEEGE